jgi:nucleoside-diphosphate-sugar epimerase
MTDLYTLLMTLPDQQIDGGVYNGGYFNDTVLNIAQTVKRVVEEYKELGEGEIELEIQPTNDNRSYHVSSEKLKKALGFQPKHTIEDAVRGLVEAYLAGKLPNAMDDMRYYNIKTMRAVGLK